MLFGWYKLTATWNVKHYETESECNIGVITDKDYYPYKKQWYMHTGHSPLKGVPMFPNVMYNTYNNYLMYIWVQKLMWPEATSKVNSSFYHTVMYICFL